MTIKDPIIEPFTIEVSDSGYTVSETKISKTGKEASQPFCYTNKLGFALVSIVNKKMARSQEFVSVAEYIQKYNEMLNEFTEKIKI